MKIDLVEVFPSELKIGDEWHDDGKATDKDDGFVRWIHSGDGVYWTVINNPIRSINQQLFWDSYSQACIVVPVKYLDGARGSRLYDPDQKLIVRRDVEQKAL